MKRLIGLLIIALLLHPRVAHAQEGSAIYTVIFESTWSQQTHPHPSGAEQFPPNAHFSRLIGATHNASVNFWAVDELASLGIENMAELGGTSVLQSEFTAAGANVYTILNGPGLSISPGSVRVDAFATTQEYPLVTLVTMVAPSPDWFVGVADLSLLDEQGRWRDQIVVTLYPYDAGSDDGSDYRSADLEPLSHHLIANIRGEAPFSDQPIGVYTFTRQIAVYLPVVTQTS